MLLVIDAGNTNITIGAYQGDELTFTSRLATDHRATRDRIAVDLASIFKLHGIERSSFTGAIISSVVPEISRALKQAVEKVTGQTPLLVGPGVKTGLNILTDNPAEVGADLVAVSVAAMNKYALPAIIVDLGTATKVIALDRNGAFLGCSIAPGIEISLNALSSGASQLINIGIRFPDHAIGTNTADSMTSGLIYGSIDMLDGMCDRFAAEIKDLVQTIVATGGLSSVTAGCRNEMVMDQDLILEGLKLIYQKNC
ncbi:MAG: type III pantothenate kinase [Eubacteriales bacterium]|nr:type III pantothenate kinase [Eubacteriales bacterium]